MKYLKKGIGQPIVFLHGFCETKEMWKTFLDTFSKKYSVLCPDLPGFGDSPLEGENITLEQIAASLQEWMKEQDVDNPVVIGHSLGGYITLALAERMGEQLKAIGLFHSSALADDKEKIAARNRTLTFVEKHGVNKFVESLIPELFSEKSRKHFQDKIDFALSMGRRTSKNGLLAYAKAMRDRKDRMEILRDFRGKKLMIAGQLDNAIPAKISRKHKDFVDNYHELPDTGHMGMFEREKETLEFIQEFLVSALATK